VAWVSASHCRLGRAEREDQHHEREHRDTDSRAFGAIRERIPGGGTGAANIAGVQVEVGEKQAAIDLDIVVEYGASIVELARAVRRNVITAVERMTGLEVIEVNIAVNDIHLPMAVDEDALPPAQSARVE
jgi:uncharacterized alkaline shock family protein YloU